MKFDNLTPFSAMAFDAVDVARNRFHVVVLKAAYALEKCASGESGGNTHRCLLQEGREAVSLSMVDDYDRAINSSVKAESDLAPFKPRCDVVIRATSYAPNGLPASWWPARARVTDGNTLVIDKRLRISGPRTFMEGQDGWRVSEPEECVEVPVRWEHTYGGTSIVARSTRQPGEVGELLLNEVCYTNPLGCGWLEERYLDLVTDRDVLATPDVLTVHAEGREAGRFRAPQIEAWDKCITAPDIVKHADGGLDARQMAEVAGHYRAAPAGIGPVGRAWTPRLQRAGTYDDEWLKTGWPYLPQDFDFGYWNGAPDDQQIPWPGPDVGFELLNLARPEDTQAGLLKSRLPGHRAITALHFVDGRIVPIEMRLDTIVIDTEEMMILLTWRAAFPPQPGLRACEARFETDPAAPLLRYREAAWQTT